MPCSKCVRSLETWFRIASRRQKDEKANPRDLYGRQVPDELKEIFAARTVMARWIAYTDTMQQKLYQISRTPGGENLDMDEIGRLFKQVKLRVTQAMPALVCSQCRAFDSQCPACGGKKWIVTKDMVHLVIPVNGDH